MREGEGLDARGMGRVAVMGRPMQRGEGRGGRAAAAAGREGKGGRNEPKWPFSFPKSFPISQICYAFVLNAFEFKFGCVSM